MTVDSAIVDTRGIPIARDVTNAVMDRIFIEIDKLDEVETPDLNWFCDIQNMLQFCGNMETGMTHAKAKTLAIAHTHWEDVPFEIRKQYNLDFMVFARAHIGGDRQDTTITNYIRTAKVWLIDKVKPLGQIRKVVRKPNDEPEMSEGKPIYTYVEFNPYEVDMSRLLRLNSRAAKGEMTERLWEMLVDPFYSCNDISLEHMRSQNVLPNEDPSLRFFMIGPSLWVKENGHEACVCEEFNWTEYEDETGLVRRAIDYLLFLLNVKLDDDIIIDMEHKRIVNMSLL